MKNVTFNGENKKGLNEILEKISNTIKKLTLENVGASIREVNANLFVKLTEANIKFSKE